MARRLLAVFAAVAVLVSAPAVLAAPPWPAPLWAVVRVDGSLARGGGAVSSAQFGALGYYQVVFNRDVTGCAYVVTAGEATALGPDDAITFSVAPREGVANGVAILEYDTILAQDSYSSGFHLVVVC